MPSASISVSAFDCLTRSIANLRANWELIPVYLGQQVVLTVLTLLSLAVFAWPVAAALAPGFGWGSLGALSEMSDAEMERALTDLLFALPDLLGPLALGLLLGTLLGGVALFVSCWFTGGTIAVLRAGDGGAEHGEPPGHRAFRAFSVDRFTTAANRLAWRFFWFVNLYLVYVLLAVLVWSLLLVVAAWSGERWGWPAALGVGCLATLPLVPVLLALGAWMWLGMAELARGDVGVRRAAGRAGRVLRRRPWAALLFLVLAVGASLVVGLGMAPVDLGTSLLLDRTLALWCVAQALIYGAQFAVSAVVGLLLAGAFVALARAEGDEVGTAVGEVPA